MVNICAKYNPNPFSSYRGIFVWNSDKCISVHKLRGWTKIKNTKEKQFNYCPGSYVKGSGSER